jgi:hypothetical protein
MGETPDEKPVRGKFFYASFYTRCAPLPIRAMGPQKVGKIDKEARGPAAVRAQ